MKDIDLTKEILSGKEIREKLLKGIETVYKSVGSTLGPMGKNVIIGLNKYGDSRITKDGVSVAKEIFLEDKFENLGAQLLKKVSMKCAKDAGDGTTTSTILARDFLYEAFHMDIKNVYQFEKGLKKACSDVIDYIKSHYTREVKTLGDIYDIAMISSNQDSEISSLIKECYEKLGIHKDLVINLDTSNYYKKSFVEITTGYQYDKGLPSPYLVNNPQKMELNLKKAHVLLFDMEIPNFAFIAPMIKEVLLENQRKPLVIMAHGFKGDSLSGIVQNATNKSNPLEIYALEAPGYGARRSLLMQDLGVQLMAEPLSEQLGNLQIDKLMTKVGMASEIISNQFTTTISFGYGDDIKIQERIESIKNSIDNNMEFDVNEAKERIARLTSGMATIHIGGSTELEIKEAYDRYEDAVWAVKSGLEEGICPGGGIAFIAASEELPYMEKDEGDLDDAYNMLLDIIKEPCYEMHMKANGIIPGDLLEICRQSDKTLIGYDLLSGKASKNVIDPLKVLRCALENAVSVCSLIISTDVGMVYKNGLSINSTLQD